MLKHIKVLGTASCERHAGVPRTLPHCRRQRHSKLQEEWWSTHLPKLCSLAPVSSLKTSSAPMLTTLRVDGAFRLPVHCLCSTSR